MFFNVNEHQTVPIVKLERGESQVGDLRFFVYTVLPV